MTKGFVIMNSLIKNWLIKELKKKSCCNEFENVVK